MMKLNLDSGTYILAISGGVDSMTLLDLIFNQFDKDGRFKFVVAHFDHGIRSDSIIDKQLVESVSKKYGFKFDTKRLEMGSKASEAKAREERYKFLFEILDKYNAKAILTAHHNNDLIETAVFNVLRGTGRKGLSSLGNQEKILRPMLKFSKSEIISYATKNNLTWREDSTNLDLKYSRNFIREKLLKKFSDSNQTKLSSLIEKQGEINRELDDLIDQFLQKISQGPVINRQAINSLPQKLASELVAEWLRKNNLRDFDKKTIHRILSGSKMGGSGSKYDVKHNYFVIVQKDQLALNLLER